MIKSSHSLEYEGKVKLFSLFKAFSSKEKIEIIPFFLAFYNDYTSSPLDL